MFKTKRYESDECYEVKAKKYLIGDFSESITRLTRGAFYAEKEIIIKKNSTMEVQNGELSDK